MRERLRAQIDTRLDRDEVLGSPVVVYLDQRARVDVVRDGRVLYSAIYEAGNQAIDTSNLPDGSYDIILRIDEPGRPEREERRFFSKSRQIPSLGRTDFFVFGGLLAFFVITVLLLGVFSNRSARDYLDWKPTRSPEVEAQNEIDDVEQMIAAQNELRRKRGAPEITREDRENILGKNFARLMGVDIEEKKRELGLEGAAQPA